jgi:Protein of unknown function, DUF273
MVPKYVISVLLAIFLFVAMAILLSSNLAKPPGPSYSQSATTDKISKNDSNTQEEKTGIMQKGSMVPATGEVVNENHDFQLDSFPRVSGWIAPNYNSNSTDSKLNMGKNKKMAIITFFSRDAGSQALKQLTFGNFQEYANRHGYDAIDAMENPFIYALFLDHMKKFNVTHYFKFHVMAYYVPNYEWILWADGDSIFLNQGISMEDLIDTNYDAIFTINRKEEPSWSLIINAGHYLLRNAPWTHQMLREAIYMSEHRCDEFLYMVPEHKPPVLNTWIHLCGSDGGYWLSDQGILQWLILYKDQG